MTWQRPSVVVRRVEALPDRTRLHCRLAEPPSEPVAPASLWSHPTSGTSAFDLHRVVRRDQDEFVFETFSIELRTGPAEGSTLYLQSHWLPAAFEAALDTTVRWEQRAYPNEGNHVHCLFTWETISSHLTPLPYWSAKYGWITSHAYEDFVVKDVYQLRDASDA